MINWLDNVISDVGLCYILKVLQLGKFIGLYSLNLSNNNITERSIKTILYTLYFCPNIRELYLSGNSIKSIGVKYMAAILSKSSSTPLTRYAKTLKMDRFNITNKLINSIM